jgi:hypothetical protein
MSSHWKWRMGMPLVWYAVAALGVICGGCGGATTDGASGLDAMSRTEVGVEDGNEQDSSLSDPNGCPYSSPEAGSECQAISMPCPYQIDRGCGVRMCQCDTHAWSCADNYEDAASVPDTSVCYVRPRADAAAGAVSE